MKHQYDKKNPKTSDFEVGQRVGVYSPKGKRHLSRKLLHCWHGPYRIIEQLSPVYYFLRNKNNRRLIFSVHANHNYHQYAGPNNKLPSTKLARMRAANTFAALLMIG